MQRILFDFYGELETVRMESGRELTSDYLETGRTEPRRVVDAFVHHDMPTYRVVIDDDQAVTTTSEHPFMVLGQGWTPVRELRKGDHLVRPDGSTVEIRSVDATGDTATVYNFEVEGVHNYYVRAGDEWLLVHNADCGISINLDKQGKHIPGHRNFDPKQEFVDCGSSSSHRAGRNWSAAELSTSS